MMNQDTLLQIIFGIVAALLSLVGIWVTWTVTRGKVDQIVMLNQSR
jgi:hypothetical protein